MTKVDVEIIINGCKALKNKHFYKEAFVELEKIKPELPKEYLDGLVHLQAQCLYQDKEESSKYRFEKAIKLLDESRDVYEKSRLKGAVYKRKYQLYKKKDDLELAIDFYSKSAENKENDRGYGAVNAIYLYVELKKITKKLYLQSLYSRKIKKLRTDALKYLNNNTFDDMKWINPTLAELYFSFNEKDKYDEARQYLVFDNEDDKDYENLKVFIQVKSIDAKTKEAIEKALNIETIFSRDNLITIEQLTRLYKLQKKDMSDADTKYLVSLFTHNMNNNNDKKVIENIIKNILIGKIGLALSGGGFRASLYHLGVFSRLAELDMLRHVDVISSVSGGSIVALHYYLKLQQLLESKDNFSIKQQDYVKLVKNMQQEFLDGVQTNIRMQAFEKYNPCNETVTQQLGRLYVSELYDRAVRGCAPRKMNQLYIYPKVEDKKTKHFNPHFNNVEFSCKVPILIINSTCLNNGHNWRFTASGMGESQYMYDTTIDKNTVHKYTRYNDFSDEFKNFTIADTVASSSCVPGLFDPIELDGAYKKDENIKLVDGGVYDNQGLASLLDEECKLIVCSDASGQFNDENNPSSCRLSVIPRINDSLMDRGRDQEYEMVKENLKDKKIDGLCILHLKQCFKVKEVIPVDKINTKVSYGIYGTELDKDVQKRLSKIRTDLDSFNDKEAYSLMNSGYQMMSKWLDQIKKEQPIWNEFKEESKEEWNFLKIKNVVKSDKKNLLKLLKNSHDLFFKIKITEVSKKCLISPIVLGILIAYLMYCFPIHLLAFIGVFFTSLVIVYIVSENLLYKVVKYISKPILWIIAKFNLKCMNEKYLEKGKVI